MIEGLSPSFNDIIIETPVSKREVVETSSSKRRKMSEQIKLTGLLEH
jgi:hypothetical protein